MFYSMLETTENIYFNCTNILQYYCFYCIVINCSIYTGEIKFLIQTEVF